MREAEILNRIKKSIDKVEIDLLDHIKESHIPVMIQHDEITRPRRRQFPRAFISVAASILILLGSWNYQARAVDSFIYLDLDSSYIITTNKKDQVIGLSSISEEGERTLKDIDYGGKNVDEVLKGIVEKIHQDKDREEDYILLSVYNKNKDKQGLKQENLKKVITAYMEEEDIKSVLLTQDILVDKSLKEDASENNLSLSRMNFIRNIRSLEPSLETENLKNLSIKDLLAEAESRQIALEKIVEVDRDKAKDKEEKDSLEERMISLEEAKSLALEASQGGEILEVELEIKEDRAKYEIEVIKDGRYYEIEIDGYSGKILEFKEKSEEKDKDSPGKIEIDKEIISLEKAKSLALEASQGGEILEVELEIKEGKAKYEIEVAKDGRYYEIEIDAYSGKILEYKNKSQEASDKDREQEEIEENLIGLDEAKAIALDKSQGGRIIEIELEIKGKKAQYEMEISKEGIIYEIEIDAYSGRVLLFREKVRR